MAEQMRRHSTNNYTIRSVGIEENNIIVRLLLIINIKINILFTFLVLNSSKNDGLCMQNKVCSVSNTSTSLLLTTSGKKTDMTQV